MNDNWFSLVSTLAGDERVHSDSQWPGTLGLSAAGWQGLQHAPHRVKGKELRRLCNILHPPSPRSAWRITPQSHLCFPQASAQQSWPAPVFITPDPRAVYGAFQLPVFISSELRVSRYLPSGFLVTIAFTGRVGLACSLFRCSTPPSMLGHCLLIEIMLWYKLLSPSRSAPSAFPGLIRATLHLLAWQTRRLSNGAAHACAKKQKWLQHGRPALVHADAAFHHALVPTQCGNRGRFLRIVYESVSLGSWWMWWRGRCLLVTSSAVDHPEFLIIADALISIVIFRYWYWCQRVLHFYS